MSLKQPAFSKYVRDFSPGFLDAPEQDTLPGGATADARNFFLGAVMEPRDSQGQGQRAPLRKRKLALMLNPTAMSVTGVSVDLLFWFQPEGTDAQLIAVSNSNLYRYNGVDAFDFVANLPGFTPGVVVQAIAFKDNVWMMNGTAMWRYNGTAVFPIGFLAPTGAPGLTIVAGGTLPIAATYESFAIWYDPVMDHESSPSPASVQATTTTGNQMRRHTKPAGTPPVNVTKWRTYVRRVDTNELNFYLTVTADLVDLTVDESLSDAARRIAGPKEQSNDIPPVFEMVAVYKDFGIGIEQDESYFSVSKRNDLESWHPADRFAIERGSGKALRSATNFGSDILLQKPTRTWRLVGDRVPFQVEPVHSDYGNVGPKSAIEVERVFYGWDEQQGPYRTDLVQWEPLATNRITTFLMNLNRDELRHIQVEHDPENTLVMWAVPCTSTIGQRRQHIIAWNYRLNCWYPPITGLEYSVLCSYQPVGGRYGSYCGDYWGRVFRLFAADREGIPGGTTILANAVSGTPGTVTVDQPLYTTGSGMAGFLVLVQSPSGGYQWRRIFSNTTDTITLDTTNDAPWTTTPGPGWIVHLGAVQAYWTTPWADFGRPELLKRGGFLFVEGRSSASGDVVSVFGRFNQDESNVFKYDFPFLATGAVWGQAIWGEALWGRRARLVTKRRIGIPFYSMQVRFESFLADKPLDLTAVGIEGDPRTRKRAA